MDILALGAILILRLFQSISNKSCSKLMPSDQRSVFAYLGMSMGMSSAGAFVLLFIEGNVIANVLGLPALGWLIALGTGVLLAVSTFCNLEAMKGSSVVLVNMFGAAGLLIPTVAGIFLYDQPVTLGQCGGIVLLFAAALLLASSSGKTNGKLGMKTLLLLFLRMLANGGIMLLQTLYKSYVPQGSVSIYSFFQFLIPAVCLLAICMAQTLGKKAAYPAMGKKLVGWTAVASLAVLGISQISTIASAFIPAGVLFPISDGGNTVISAVVAAIMFKEKMTWQSVCGVIVGVVGLVMIKLLAVG